MRYIDHLKRTFMSLICIIYLYIYLKFNKIIMGSAVSVGSDSTNGIGVNIFFLVKSKNNVFNDLINGVVFDDGFSLFESMELFQNSINALYCSENIELDSMLVFNLDKIEAPNSVINYINFNSSSVIYADQKIILNTGLAWLGTTSDTILISDRANAFKTIEISNTLISNASIFNGFLQNLNFGSIYLEIVDLVVLDYSASNSAASSQTAINITQKAIFDFVNGVPALISSWNTELLSSQNLNIDKALAVYNKSISISDFISFRTVVDGTFGPLLHKNEFCVFDETNLNVFKTNEPISKEILVSFEQNSKIYSTKSIPANSLNNQINELTEESILYVLLAKNISINQENIFTSNSIFKINESMAVNSYVNNIKLSGNTHATIFSGKNLSEIENVFLSELDSLTLFNISYN